jgi:hypothetical protein
VSNVGQGCSGLSSDIYDNFIKILASYMVPDRQLAYSAQSVDTKLHPSILPVSVISDPVSAKATPGKQ